jgi:uncharacterized membrane protein
VPILCRRGENYEFTISKNDNHKKPFCKTEGLFLWFLNIRSCMREKTYRSVVKTISWRTIGTIDTILIAWLVIGKLEFAVTIGGIELFTKMILYFLHERTWNRIKFGKIDESDIEYQI